MKRILVATILPVVLASAGLAGCASNAVTTDELEDLKKQVSEAKSGNADAMGKAEEALAAANSAKADAANALSVANEAKSMSEATESKLDQMFKKAMYK